MAVAAVVEASSSGSGSETVKSEQMKMIIKKEKRRVKLCGRENNLI